MNTHGRSVLTFSLFIFVVVGLLAYQLVVSGIEKSRLSTASDASEGRLSGNTDPGALRNCPLSVEVFVDEIDSIGNQVPLEPNGQNFGFTDALQSDIIRFNHDQFALYSIKNPYLSFSIPANSLNTYINETYTELNLIYPRDIYEIVQKEVVACNAVGNTEWLCNNDLSDDLSTISGVFVGCNTEINLGWTLRKMNAVQSNTANTESELSDTTADPQNTIIRPIISELGDVNADGTVNVVDLLEVIDAYGTSGEGIAADIDDSGRVDALDYTIVIKALSTSTSQ